MAWYHFLGIYLCGSLALFVGMAREDARRLSVGEKAMWSNDVPEVLAGCFLVLTWPIIVPVATAIWATMNGYKWPVRVFMPKPAKAVPPPPDPVPGDGYRDGGKVCTCGARRG